MKQKHILAHRRYLKGRMSGHRAISEVLAGMINLTTDDDERRRLRRAEFKNDGVIAELESELHGAHPKDFYGSARTTFKFRNGWSAEDDWEGVGIFRILNRKPISESDDGDYASELLTLRAPAHATNEQIRSVLLTCFTYGCQCEHDCCGHWFGSSRNAKHTKRREWTVQISHSRNV